MNIRPLTQLREMITAALRSQTNIGKSFQSFFIETMELNIRITPEIHSKVAILARQNGISINAFIKKAIENQVAMSL